MYRMVRSLPRIFQVSCVHNFNGQVADLLASEDSPQFARGSTSAAATSSRPASSPEKRPERSGASAAAKQPIGKLEIREKPDGEVYVEGATESKV